MGRRNLKSEAFFDQGGVGCREDRGEVFLGGSVEAGSREEDSKVAEAIGASLFKASEFEALLLALRRRGVGGKRKVAQGENLFVEQRNQVRSIGGLAVVEETSASLLQSVCALSLFSWLAVGEQWEQHCVQRGFSAGIRGQRANGSRGLARRL